DGSQPPAQPANRSAALQRLGYRPDSRLPVDRVPLDSRLRADRHTVHDPQPGLPRALLALGHGADGTGLEVLQLAADGVLWPSEPDEDWPGIRRLAQHGQS